MKVIKPSVGIIDQEPGVIGMKKHIERVGRIAYKSEDRITEDSYIQFIEMLYKRGHWAVFNLGTVYLKVPKGKSKKTINFYLESLSKTLYTKFNEDDSNYYITTNYRVICQLKLESFMEEFWSEPEELHYHRVTSHWICSRSTSHQVIRHRCLSPIQESQRYVNYSLEKNGNEITYILPQWVYDVREDIATTLDPMTYLPRGWIMKLDGEELWETLCCHDRTVSGHDRIWKMCEDEYIFEITTDESCQLKPEDARGVLCNDTKTELCLCGYLEDWFYTPSPETPEKTGFFYLRTAPDAQRDIRVLATDLKEQFIARGFDQLL